MLKSVLKVEGPLKITSSAKKSITIEPNSTKSVTFGILAQSQVGAGKIIFETTGLANIKEEIDIAVRPTSPLIVETGSGTIEAGKEIKINIPKNFLKGTQSDFSNNQQISCGQICKAIEISCWISSWLC